MTYESLLCCAEALVGEHWYHGDDLLSDAEIEISVSYELFESDLEKVGALQQFLGTEVAEQWDAFLSHLGPGKIDPSAPCSLDEIPTSDWLLVWIRYHAGLLRAASGVSNVECEFALTIARLQWTILVAPSKGQRQ